MSDSFFGFSEFTTWPWSFREDLGGYAQAGAQGIEICEFKLPHHDYAGLLKEIPEHGLRAASVQMFVHSVFKDSMASRPEDPADRLEEMKLAMSRTAPYVPKETPFVIITGIAPDGNIRAARERTVRTLKELGEHAASLEMRVAFEPLSPVNIHTDTAVWGLDQGLEIIEEAGHPSVGLCIDSWNVWQTPSVEDVIAQCANRIFLVQLSDWRTPRSTADRYSLGDGEIPLAPMMRAIRRTGYRGPWIVEILSSYHLPGSLWKTDLNELLRTNASAFKRLWEESAP
jgi:sugar phosphate isomerase/epimerase